MSWALAALTDVGRERTRNEDAVAILDHGPDDHTLIVCDGMGGHADGDVASALGVATITEHVRAHVDDPEVFRVLHEAMLAADRAVALRAQGQTMGSTAVVARVRGARCWYGWVGDSRLYLFRDGRLIERSEDHTRVAGMVASGELTADEARHHPDAHLLTQALGVGNAQPTVYAEPVELAPGDLLVLCSDGLHDLVEPDEIPGLLRGLAPSDAARRLVDTANARGGHDNVTAIVARWEEAALPARATAVEELPPPPAERRRAGPLVLAAIAGAVIGSALTAWWLGRGSPPGGTP